MKKKALCNRSMFLCAYVKTIVVRGKSQDHRKVDKFKKRVLQKLLRCPSLKTGCWVLKIMLVTLSSYSIMFSAFCMKGLLRGVMQ